MVMEFCPGGELFTAIKKQPEGRLTGTYTAIVID
jgi:hypothetical protein